MNFGILVSLLLFLIPMEVRMIERSTAVKLKKSQYDIVTVTMYSPSVEECDSTPLITASGYKINPINPRKQKIIAISWDLKKKYKFGKKVKVLGIGKYSGTYTVRDLMNKRHKKRIDILVNVEDKQTKFERAKLYKI
jgi:3D (Asp-Asp-Asp) domain-containing protein